MGLQRVKWAERERIELGDLQALSDQSLLNLSAVLQAGFQPTGIMRGGALTADGTFMLSLAPLLAIDQFNPNGIVIVDTDTPIGPFSGNSDDGANPSHFDRYDLISIQYAESTVTANRTFINSDASTSDGPSPVRIVSGFNTQITEGAYGSPAAPPATPVGFIPIGLVRVPWGATGITQDLVQALTAQRPATDPSLFYPRFHYAALISGNRGDATSFPAFPLVYPLFALPAQSAEVVGLFTCSFSLFAPNTSPSYFRAIVTGGGMDVAQADIAVPAGDLTAAWVPTMHFSLSGMLYPTVGASTYSLTLKHIHMDPPTEWAHANISCYVRNLRASVVYFPTIAPWPGKTVA